MDPVTGRVIGEAARAALGPGGAVTELVGGGGPTTSGGGFFDNRSLFDSSGWTVATGRSAAYGANVPRPPAHSFLSTPTGGPPGPLEVGPSGGSGGLLSAGYGGWLALALGGVALAAVVRSRRNK